MPTIKLLSVPRLIAEDRITTEEGRDVIYKAWLIDRWPGNWSLDIYYSLTLESKEVLISTTFRIGVYDLVEVSLVLSNNPGIMDKILHQAIDTLNKAFNNNELEFRQSKMYLVENTIRDTICFEMNKEIRKITHPNEICT